VSETPLQGELESTFQGLECLPKGFLMLWRYHFAWYIHSFVRETFYVWNTETWARDKVHGDYGSVLAEFSNDM